MAAPNAREVLLQVLKQIRYVQPADPTLGICAAVIWRIRENFPGIWVSGALDLLHSTFDKWPKRSGALGYPVPAPDEWVEVMGFSIKNGATAMVAFNELPLWEGEYGDLRRELLDWTIAELEKEGN